jgi:hypothetical protein
MFQELERTLGIAFTRRSREGRPWPDVETRTLSIRKEDAMQRIALTVMTVAMLATAPLLANRAEATTLGSATNVRLPGDAAKPFEEVRYRYYRRRHFSFYPRFRAYAYYPYYPYRSYHFRRFHYGYY